MTCAPSSNGSRSLAHACIVAWRAKKELASAESELAKWGDKPLDGDYVNLQARASWARARLDAAAH